MSKDQKKDLLKFLKPFDKETKEITLWLRDFVWDLYPKSNELIYDNYNSLAFGWSTTDGVGHLFCTISVGRTNQAIQFGFYFGNTLSDPDKILIGKGKQYRYLVVKDKKSFPKQYIKKLLKESYTDSLKKVQDKKLLMEGKTITKSISTKKRELKSKPLKKK